MKVSKQENTTVKGAGGFNTISVRDHEDEVPLLTEY